MLKTIAAASLFLSLLATHIVAQESRKPTPNSEKFGSRFLDRLSSTELPFIGEEEGLSIDVRPKFGDIVREPLVRLPIELTYGFTPNREGSIGIVPMFKNPFKSDAVSSTGLLTLGMKQRINNLADNRMNLAVGIYTQFPLDHIPSERARDSFDLYMPYVTAAYRLDERNRWLAFTNFQYHLVGSDRREFMTPGPDPRSLGVLRPGIIFQPEGEFRYSLQLEYKTDRIDGGSEDGYKIIPGITWFPPADTPVFRSIAGHFELAFELEYALREIPEERGGNDIGLRLGVRWRLYPKKPEPEESVL